jgi:hypothetical protein
MGLAAGLEGLRQTFAVPGLLQQLGQVAAALHQKGARTHGWIANFEGQDLGCCGLLIRAALKPGPLRRRSSVGWNTRLPAGWGPSNRVRSMRGARASSNSASLLASFLNAGAIAAIAHAAG